MKKNEGICRKYERNMKKYEGNMKEYVENMKKCEGNMKKYEGTKDLEEFQQGGWKSYADADTIPGMAPSTEREGGFPANVKKI